MQIPILNGVYTDNSLNVGTSYPVNLMPVPKQSGVNAGYLRPADGIKYHTTGPGIDRGGICWRDICYRVMGTKLVTISETGTITTLGDVGGPTDQQVTFDYGFDRLAIASGGRLFYWNGSALTAVTDPDLGAVIDVLWVDGYFMTTDGEHLVITELTDPTQVNPLKYGSAEADPDPVMSLVKLRNEVYALNRHTIEVFDNVGGEFFPFRRIEGAQIQKGVVGARACCVLSDVIAFLGSGRNEVPAIYLGANASASKISTQEIDRMLQRYSARELSQVILESREDSNHSYLYVHLVDRTLVYDLAASKELNIPIWFVLTSGLHGVEQYRARNMVWAYGKWLVGDPQSANLGFLCDKESHHWGNIVQWEFGTTFVYNEGKGAIFHELELVALTGRVALDSDPTISTSYSSDGRSWSQEKFIKVGGTGETTKRLCWFQQGHMRHIRVQRFKGNSQAHLSFLRLEAKIEPLAF